MNKETYDDFSQDYDHFVNWEARLTAEMPFISEYLRHIESQTDRKPKVLDTACGSGMHAIELAKRGYSACGADLSPKMIEKAAANANAAEIDVLFKVSPFGSLANDFRMEAEFPFNLIVCLGNALPHLLSLNQIRSALNDLAASLEPGGILMLQNRNFDAILKLKERWIAPQSHQEGNQEWVFLRFYDFDADGLITFNIVRLYQKGSQNWQQQVSTTRLYPLTRDILIDLLKSSGFNEITCYGLMSKNEPFNPASSENLVVTARRV